MKTLDSLSNLEKNENSLRRFFLFSLFFHLLIFFVLYGVGQWIMGEKSSLREYNMNLVESSVRVDVVAMPELTVQELKSLKESPSEAKVKEASEKPQVEKTKQVESSSEIEYQKEALDKVKKKKNFQDLLKKMSQEDVREKISKTVETSDSGVESESLNKLIVSGNKLSDGTTLVGESQKGLQSDLARYAASMVERVRLHWKLPSYLKEQNLRCRIQIFLRKNGDLSHAKVIESSGNTEYDNRALRAIRSARFSPVDEKIASSVSSGEIVLGFPL